MEILKEYEDLFDSVFCQRENLEADGFSTIVEILDAIIIKRKTQDYTIIGSTTKEKE